MAAKESSAAAYVSFDTGLKFRPVKAFFQNMLCSFLGIDVIYAFGGFKFQQLISSLDFPVRLVHFLYNRIIITFIDQ